MAVGDIKVFIWSSYWARSLSIDELNSLTCDPDDVDLGYGDFAFPDSSNAPISTPCVLFDSLFSGAFGK